MNRIEQRKSTGRRRNEEYPDERTNFIAWTGWGLHYCTSIINESLRFCHRRLWKIDENLIGVGFLSISISPSLYGDLTGVDSALLNHLGKVVDRVQS